MTNKFRFSNIILRLEMGKMLIYVNVWLSTSKFSQINQTIFSCFLVSTTDSVEYIRADYNPLKRLALKFHVDFQPLLLSMMT